MKTCIPADAVTGPDRPGYRDLSLCPVCRETTTPYVSPDTWIHVGTRCNECNLFEAGRGARVGFVWLVTTAPLYNPEHPLRRETYTLHERRSEWAAFTLSSAMEWLVFADWLEEQGFPLNAAGIRANFSSPFEEYK